MKQVVVWIQSFAMAFGGPGLFVVGFLDSSILSLPEINDILLIWMVVQHKERLLYYALMSTAGSIAGCFFLYYVGRKGGDAVLRKRFRERHVERGLQLFQRYGLLAVVVPAILPPPAPFKIFVLLAGVARVDPVTFAVAIGIGRGFRFIGEGVLAAWYGDQAISFVRANGISVSIVVATLVAIGGAAYIVWRARMVRTDVEPRV